MALFNEIRTADQAGFSRFADFRRARKRGLFPEPVQEIPGVGPLWSDAQIDEFAGRKRNGSETDRSAEALARLG